MINLRQRVIRTGRGRATVKSKSKDYESLDSLPLPTLHGLQIITLGRRVQVPFTTFPV